MLLTVMFQGPSSCASWRVSPICAARDVDDAAPARPLHPRRDRLREVERSGHVHVEDALPLLRRDLLERATDLPEDAAGVVHEDVNACGLGDECVDGRLVAHVHDTRRA